MADTLHNENKVIEKISSKFKIEAKFLRVRMIWVTTD